MKKKLFISEDNEYLKFLKKEKEISDSIINHSRSMISVINRNYIYEKVNATFCEMHQVPVDSVVGKSLGEVWGHSTFEEKIKSNLDLCFLGETIRYEASFNTPSIGKRYFEVIFRPLNIENGVITHLLAETFDVNDLRQSERAVIEKEEEFRNFETKIPIGLLRCNPSGKILHANRAFVEILRCSDEISMTRMNLRSFYPDQALFDIQYDQLLESNSKAFGRIILKNCEGIDIPCRISGFMAYDNNGSPSFIDFAIEDASRELMLENRLLQAQKLETIGSLAGGIAHDFNNILATISGYSEMLIDDLKRNSDQKDKVKKILNAVTRAKSITNQILTFSRHIEQEKIQVDVADVLDETIGFVRSAAPSGITVRKLIRKKGVNVFADPTQLFRVFLNLMTNAIQSMEEYGGTLSVSMVTTDGKLVKHELNKDIVADEYVVISFEDTGIGMDDAVMNRVFEPFYTTREVGKGSGLGLSVVHGIVSELEGEIVVSGIKGKGSVFHVYLPLSKTYPEVSEEKEQKKKVLFITGDKYESRILSLALKNSGFELIFTSDTQKFLKIMASVTERPDIVIYMSDSKKIQTDDLITVFNRQNINIPCILISDINHTLREENLLNSGIIKHHLIKPVSLKEIRNAILSSLK